MKRGTIVILLILIVAVVAAAFSMFFHYRNQHRAQAFWGTSTAVLIDRAPKVEVLKLGAPGGGISLDDAGERAEEPATDAKSGEQPDAKPEDKPEESTSPKAVEFGQVPWLVVASKDAQGAKGIANLRRALVLDTTYDWAHPTEPPEPNWEYGVSVSDGKNWAAVLFDFESRQVGLTGGRKTVLLEPEANEEFRRFFAEQFPESKPDGAKEADAS